MLCRALFSVVDTNVHFKLMTTVLAVNVQFI